MSLRPSATRYARALLEVAVQESDPAAVERDLAAASDLLRDSAELAAAVANPGVPSAARAAIMSAVAARAGFAPPVAKLLTLLARRGRMELVPDLIEVYRERLLAHGNVVRAEVASAAPLSADASAALEGAFARATGKRVQLAVRVDPDLVGGIVARIGSTVYDGSVRTQLAAMRRQLVEHA